MKHCYLRFNFKCLRRRFILFALVMTTDHFSLNLIFRLHWIRAKATLALRHRAFFIIYPHHKPWVTNVILFTCAGIKTNHTTQVAERKWGPLSRSQLQSRTFKCSIELSHHFPPCGDSPQGRSRTYTRCVTSDYVNTLSVYYKGFPNRGDMILNVPIGLIWTEIFDVCCQLSSVRFAI